MKKMALCIVELILSCTFAAGQQYKVLWSFTGGLDGGYPAANLIFDPAGNLYGTTQYGGTAGGGTVFELSPQPDGGWTESVLYSFCSDQEGNICLDGSLPSAGLVLDPAGNIYGTTFNGGNTSCPGDIQGCGTVFELSPPTVPGGFWTKFVLYNFCSDLGAGNRCLDGSYPLSQLVVDADGNLYGTTLDGGSGRPTEYDGGGTVFELSPEGNGWMESVLYNFCSIGQRPHACQDGSDPHAGITFDKSGKIYGTTEYGGQLDAGTVYRLSPKANGWTETVLGNGGSNRGYPVGAVSIDPRGSLYGTASRGGSSGGGAVFRLTEDGGAAVLFFDSSNGGYLPAAGVLLDPSHRALYGTTEEGGTGWGNVYEIVPPAQMTSLYSFCSQSNCTDGASPVAGLIEDSVGNLYGTAKLGGTGTRCGSGGCGVVFEIVRSPTSPRRP